MLGESKRCKIRQKARFCRCNSFRLRFVHRAARFGVLDVFNPNRTAKNGPIGPKRHPWEKIAPLCQEVVKSKTIAYTLTLDIVSKVSWPIWGKKFFWLFFWKADFGSCKTQSWKMSKFCVCVRSSKVRMLKFYFDAIFAKFMFLASFCAKNYPSRPRIAKVMSIWSLATWAFFYLFYGRFFSGSYTCPRAEVG